MAHSVVGLRSAILATVWLLVLLQEELEDTSCNKHAYSDLGYTRNIMRIFCYFNVNNSVKLLAVGQLGGCRCTHCTPLVTPDDR